MSSYRTYPCLRKSVSVHINHSSVLGLIFVQQLFFKNKCFSCVCVSISWMYVRHVCAWYPWTAEEGITFLGNGVTGVVSCHMGAGLQTQALCQSGKCSKWLATTNTSFSLSFFVLENLIHVSMNIITLHPFLFYLFILCVYVCRHTHVTMCMQRSEDSSWVLSFHQGAQAEIRPGGCSAYWESHSP